MTRSELKKHIYDCYGIESDSPWMSDPGYIVFRHTVSRKWFGILMDIPRRKLDGKSDRITDVLNLKCDPMLIDLLVNEKGIYRAYHMNKSKWISVVIEDVDDQQLARLIDLSYELTMDKMKKPKNCK